MKRIYSVWVVFLLFGGAVAMAEPGLQPEDAHTIDSVLVVRPFGTPLTLQEIEQVRTNVKANYEHLIQNAGHPVAFSTFDVPEGSVIAAYGFKLFASMAAEFVGLAGDPQSVPLIHKDARKWYNDDSEGKDAQILAGSWVKIKSDVLHWYQYPYGGITNNYELRKCANDGSSVHDWYAIRHTFRILPGYSVYGTAWENYRGFSIHNWSSSTFNNPQLRDWSPWGAHAGPVNLTPCISGSPCPLWCWTFHLAGGTTMYAQSSSGAITAKWEMQFTTDIARRRNRRMDPGSSCRVDQPGAGHYKLLWLKSRGVFRHETGFGYAYQGVEYTWHLYVKY